MTLIVKKLADGSEAEFDSEKYSPEVIDRYVADFNSKYKGPGLSEALGETPPGLPDMDPSQYEGWGKWVDKNVRAAARGTTYGVAKGLDYFAASPLNALLDDAKSMAGYEVSPSSEVHPLQNLLDRYAAPVPEGSTYQTVNDTAETWGPVAAAELATAGLATPELGPLTAVSRLGKAGQAVARGTSAVARNTAKAAARTGVIVPAAQVGGGIGGSVGEMVGGDTGRKFGEAAGAMFLPAGVVPVAHSAASRYLTVPEAAETLARIKRLNANLPGHQQITPTLGTGGIGSKPMQAIEDTFGRSPLGAKPIIDARRGLNAGMEQSIADAAAALRGGPATGQITKETLGQESAFMADKLVKKAQAEITATEQALEAQVGRGTPVDATSFFDAMDNIIKNPTKHDAAIVDHAKSMRDKLKRNMPVIRDPNGNPIPYTGDEPIREDLTYGATKDRRSKIGKSIKKAKLKPEGGGPELATESEGYKELTNTMDDAAIAAGVPDFAARQAQTKQNRADINEVEPLTRLPTETRRGNALFGGDRKYSLDQFDPYARQVPETLGPIMANALELRLRGPGNAGLDPNPNTFKPGRMAEEWTKPGEDYRRAYTQNGDPTVPGPRQTLDDVAELAWGEENRKGKRTAPGQAGSTMGQASVQNSITSAATGGTIFGAGNYMDSPAAMAAGSLVAGAPLINYGLAKAFTSPSVVNALVNPGNLIARAIRRASEAAIAEGANKSRQGDTDRERDWEAQQGRQYTR